MNAAELEQEINKAITDSMSIAGHIRNDAPSRELLAETFCKIIGPFEDHVEFTTEVRGHSVVCNFKSKDELGEALLRKIGIIQVLDVPIHEITFNVDITPKA
jgi:hypothetical protein